MYYVGQDLSDIRDKYGQIWKQIKSKYKSASGSIQFNVKGEFVSVNDSFGGVLKKNHFVFLDSDAKKKAQNLLKANKDTPEENIRKLLWGAPLNPECNIVVIWDDLDYELIALLQNDPLVDLNLTPKTRASIRIVLGVIGKKKDESHEKT